MTQKDQKELSEIARSISALFGGEVEPEATATVPSSGAVEDHVEVASALGLESALDINAEASPTAAPVDESPAELGAPGDVAAHEETDITGIEEPDLAGIEEADAVEIEEPAAVEIEEPAVVEIEEPDVAEIEEPDVAEIAETPEDDPALSGIAQALTEAASQYLEAPT